MSIKLLAEVNIGDVNFLIEEAAEGKPKGYFIEGYFMQADIKNRNGRVYPLNVLQKECVEYNKNFISRNRALGELGHPVEFTPTINPDKVSHIITSLKQEGKNFIGKAKILDTPMGKIAKNFMDEGIQLGVSTRGFGTVESGYNVDVVSNDFKLSTVDIVHDPSAYECFVNNIMESKEYYWENGVLLEKQYDQVKQMVKNAKTEKDLFEQIEKFFKTL